MKKKIFCLAVAVLMLAGFAVSANDNVYLFFATEGGSNVDFLQMPRGTVVNLDEFITEKAGYEFDGWYGSPNEMTNRLTETVLEENTILWAKWKAPEGLSERQIENEILSRTVIGNHVVLQTFDNEIKIVPVSEIWLQQNARLEALMKVHNEYFNK
ncbi:MAG: InlB B-repeat-containing protein [Clostridia bacterium]|nr:InlB B-repeat-containing protein [Clostridia bacterium]